MRSKTTIIGLIYLVGALLIAFVINKGFTSLFAELEIANQSLLFGDNFRLSTLFALLIAGGAGVYGYLNSSSRGFVSEVIDEISKVSWPEMSETRMNTVVVIVFSFIAAGILGVFDSVFSWLTNNNLFLY